MGGPQWEAGLGSGGLGGRRGGIGLGVAMVIVHTLSAHCLPSSLYYHGSALHQRVDTEI